MNKVIFKNRFQSIFVQIKITNSRVVSTKIIFQQLLIHQLSYHQAGYQPEFISKSLIFVENWK